jgi:hypothetical protein
MTPTFWPLQYPSWCWIHQGSTRIRHWITVSFPREWLETRLTGSDDSTFVPAIDDLEFSGAAFGSCVNICPGFSESMYPGVGLSAKETSRSSGMYSIYLAVLQQKLVPRPVGTNLMPKEGVMLTPVAVRFEALWSIWYCYASETRNRLSYLFVYLSITLVHSLRCVVG